MCKYVPYVCMNSSLCSLMLRTISDSPYEPNLACLLWMSRRAISREHGGIGNFAKEVVASLTTKRFGECVGKVRVTVFLSNADNAGGSGLVDGMIVDCIVTLGEGR